MAIQGVITGKKLDFHFCSRFRFVGGWREKRLSLLIALFLQRLAIKWWNWKQKETNKKTKKKRSKTCNKTTLLTIFLFIPWACLSLRKWSPVKMFLFAKWIILCLLCFQKLREITGSSTVLTLGEEEKEKKKDFVHVSVGNIFAKPLSCTPSRIEQMLLTICKSF